jgi:hypothetical protein
MNPAFGEAYDFESILARMDQLIALLQTGDLVQTEIGVEVFLNDMRVFSTPHREPMIGGRVRYFDSESGLSHSAVTSLVNALARVLGEIRATRVDDALVTLTGARPEWARNGSTTPPVR